MSTIPFLNKTPHLQALSNYEDQPQFQHHLLWEYVKARLHGSPRLINTVESTKLNSMVERYCLQGSTKVNEAVDIKMAANELVQEGVVVICDYLIKECQHI